jgi:hypothetical protein
MNYCTVGDHHHNDNQKVLPFGAWQGHDACPPCYVKAYLEAVIDRERVKTLAKIDADRKRKAFDAERAAPVNTPKTVKPKESGPKTFKPGFVEFLKTYCPPCHTKWPECKDKVAHRARYGLGAI